MEFEEPRQVSDEIVNQLEANALAAAEAVVLEDKDSYFYMVGYTAAQYRLDGYPMSTLQGHFGGHLFNIFNLAIQHRTLAVLLFLNSQHMKVLAIADYGSVDGSFQAEAGKWFCFAGAADC